MRMSISLNLLSAGSPSCMPNSDVGFCNLLTNLSDQSIDAVNRFLGLLSTFDHFFLNYTVIVAECYDACTIISSVFKKLDSHC